MAIIAIDEEVSNTSEAKLAANVADWLRKCEKTLDFVHNYEPGELSVIEALQGDPSHKIFDPYGYMSEAPLNKKVESIENDKGKPLARADDISGKLVVTLTTGEELSGRWVEGRREGPGVISGPRLEKVIDSNE